MKKTRLFLLGLVLACASTSQATNTLKVQSVEIAPGESVALSIELENETANLMGWQCDIVLPEGLTLAQKANGKPTAKLGERFNTTEHTISSSRLANGAYRFIATSLDGEAIPGIRGALFTVTLQADIILKSGTTLTGVVTNIEFNTQDNQKLTHDDVSITVTIPEVEVQKCATPTIAYDKGKLIFSCETDGVEYEYEITAVGKNTNGELSIFSTYNVKIYAMKDGYEDSDVVTKEIKFDGDFITNVGDVNGDGIVNIADLTKMINTYLGK